MRTTPRIVQGLVASAVALAVLASTLSSFGQTDHERFATVLKIKGTARIMVNGKKAPLEVGQELKPGTEIQTGADSFVDLRLGDVPVKASSRLSVGNPAASTIYSSEETAPNVLHVYENTIVGIEKLMEMNTGVDKVSDTQLNLKAGKILGNVKKLSAASHYEVKLPTGVAGIRGSTFVIGADGTVTMLSGSAVISMVIPIAPGSSITVTETFTVNAGETFNPATVIATIQQIAAQANGGVPPNGANVSPAVITAAQNAANTLAGMQPGTQGGPTQIATQQQLADAARDLPDQNSNPVTISSKDNTVIFVSPK